MKQRQKIGLSVLVSLLVGWLFWKRYEGIELSKLLDDYNNSLRSVFTGRFAYPNFSLPGTELEAKKNVYSRIYKYKNYYILFVNDDLEPDTIVWDLYYNRNLISQKDNVKMRSVTPSKINFPDNYNENVLNEYKRKFDLDLAKNQTQIYSGFLNSLRRNGKTEDYVIVKDRPYFVLEKK